MNLQTFIEAVPGYLWSDGNGSTSGLAMTAELFLLSLVPGMALAVLLAISQAYGRVCWPGPSAASPGFSAAPRFICS